MSLGEKFSTARHTIEVPRRELLQKPLQPAARLVQALGGLVYGQKVGHSVITYK